MLVYTTMNRGIISLETEQIRTLLKHLPQDMVENTPLGAKLRAGIQGGPDNAGSSSTDNREVSVFLSAEELETLMDVLPLPFEIQGEDAKFINDLRMQLQRESSKIN